MSQKSYLPHAQPMKSCMDLSYFELDTHERHWGKTINEHPFNHQVAIFFPGVSPESVQSHIAQDMGHYYEIELSLASLLEKNFFTHYIQSDTSCLILHSVDTHLDTDDVVVLDSKGNNEDPHISPIRDLVFMLTGSLTLSLTKSTYEIFGITAKKQSRPDKTRQKYVVEIDLKNRTMAPGSKMYERLKWCFENNMSTQFKMVAALTDKVTGSTMDIQWPEGVVARKMSYEVTVDSLTNIKVPVLNHLLQSEDNVDEKWVDEAKKAIEWLGLVHLKSRRISATDGPEPFVSVYQLPEPTIPEDKGTLVRWRGLIPLSVVNSIFVTLRKMMEAQVVQSWVSFSVWGYRDSPFTWNGKQHYYFVNGENDYTFLLLPPIPGRSSQRATLYQMLGSHHIE
ncbi:Ribonuclease P protein subunit p40 [Apophysomyces ossiformis]|uniref:Ribonuclease P protein subunit p40 n=1 Tax=Apophysomyces ossiformis TaxID=679940 RepID=A0A8H7BFH4_9FUNG|nr:Ribonuclease P protein subunit p40 [Apophysomyces ossiformis]